MTFAIIAVVYLVGFLVTGRVLAMYSIRYGPLTAEDRMNILPVATLWPISIVIFGLIGVKRLAWKAITVGLRRDNDA